VAGGYVAPDGAIVGNSAIVIAGGKIKEVLPSEKFNQIEGVVRWPDAVVSPGLIDLRSEIGAYGRARESAAAIDPGASANASLDATHEQFQRAVAAGITTVMIAPEPNNLVSGAAVVVKTAGRDSNSVLREDGPLMLALGPTTWDYDREPTSRIGALAMMRQVLSEAKEGKAHPRLQAFGKGELDGFIYCGEPMDVSAALRTFSEHNAKFNVIHTSDEAELASELAAAKVGLVAGPYSFDMPPLMLSIPAKISAANVPVAFAGNMPRHSAEALRASAALAVRHGMEAAKARQAMTSVPATMAGVGDRLGSIAPGLDADLVVFSGDPLRLDSRVLEVYVNGVRVYRSEDSL
jgi:imidazolonepropionase-like amidohydrolase